MLLRWYQSEAVAATWDFLCSRPGNPVCVLPTGAGKSIVIAQLCRDAVDQYGGRVIVLAHRKELLEQNAGKIRALLPDMEVGLYSAGLHARNTEAPIVVAGIQSAFRRATEFGRRDLVIVDEAHLVPFDGEGMYRKFIADLRAANERMRMVGLTATPYRLDCGPLCRPDGLFQKVCYSAPVQRLIADGFLCYLVTRPADSSADTSGLRVRGGEFVSADSEALFTQDILVQAACREIVAKSAGRKSVLLFCSGVAHAQQVASTIASLTGQRCGLVTGETFSLERETTLAAFRCGELRMLCNVDVLTIGFDAPEIDCIAVLRATMSAGLFAQICGRGFRMAPAKQDCLVLDFGENIKRHGPLDAIEYGTCRKTGSVAGEAPVKTCPNCECECYAGSRECECGFLFPDREPNHNTAADAESQILARPQEWIVESVTFNPHSKRGGTPDDPSTLRVDYVCIPADGGGNLAKTTISEWVCLEHRGFAREKAVRWWRSRSVSDVPTEVSEAVDLGRRGAVAWPERITTIRQGKWYRIVAAKLEKKPQEWVTENAEPADAFAEEVPF